MQVRGNGLLVEGLQVGQQAELVVQPRGANVKGDLQVQVVLPGARPHLCVVQCSAVHYSIRVFEELSGGLT